MQRVDRYSLSLIVDLCMGCKLDALMIKILEDNNVCLVLYKDCIELKQHVNCTCRFFWDESG